MNNAHNLFYINHTYLILTLKQSTLCLKKSVYSQSKLIYFPPSRSRSMFYMRPELSHYVIKSIMYIRIH